MSLQQAAQLIRQGQRFLVTGHVSPDPDAVGSMLGLAAILEALGKDVVLYNRDPIPETLQFLAGAASVLRRVPPGERFDATFVMDTAARNLLPSNFPSRGVTGPVVIVDHHVAHDDFGDVVVRDVAACATGEVVLQIMQCLGVYPVPTAAAEPLYAAIVADTGGFRHPGTTAETLRMAANLLESGVDPWRVAYHVFEAWPMERLRLLGRVTEAIEVECDGRLAIQCVPSSMLVEVGASEQMVEGMVEYGRRLRGVEIAALLWERQPRADETAYGQTITRVSFRSTGVADVARVATALGGGGHRAAAGATLRVNLEKARAMVLWEARQELVRARHTAD